MAADSLRARDIEPRVLSGGSTPTLEASLATGVPTELRPGVYALNDAQQWELGSATAEMLAITCEATVVSHASGRVVLDAGGKALAADRAAYNTGYGAAPRLPRRARRAAVRAPRRRRGSPPESDPPALGSRVRVVPNHVCAAVNLADTLWADTGDELVPWTVAARGRNT